MQSLFTSLRSIGFLTIALTIALAANFAYGEWASPPEAPPADNIKAPVNVGTSTQTKTGDFGAWNLSAGEKVKVSTTTGNGQVWSPQYCDGEGENCLKTSDMKGSTNSGGGTTVISRFRNFTGESLPAPPGVSEWPDYIVCQRTFGVVTRLPLHEPGLYGGLPWGRSERMYVTFDEDGVWRSGQQVTNCGGGVTLHSICQAGLCGFYDGSTPSTHPGVCNAYGCADHDDDLLVCDAYGCSPKGG